MFFTWWRQLSPRPSQSSRRSRRTDQRRRCWPWAEHLEGRTLLSFGAPQTITLGGSPNFIAAGHFDVSGHLDLITNTGVVLLGDGQGNFMQGAGPGVGGSNSASVAVGEFDGDHVDDLVAFSSAGLTLFKGNNDGTFEPGVTVLAATTASSVVAGKFHTGSDTNLDLALNNGDVLLSNGNGTFTTVTGAVPVNGVSLAVGDFNGGGKSNLAVISADVSGATEVSLLTWDSLGHFALLAPPLSVPGAQALAAGKFTGGTQDDLAVLTTDAANNNSVSVVHLDAQLGLKALATPVSLGGATFDSLAAGDFDGTGVSGLAVAAQGMGDNLVILRGDPTAGLVPDQKFNFGSFLGTVVTGKFTSDKFTDVAVAAFGGAIFGGPNGVVLLSHAKQHTTTTLSPSTTSLSEGDPLSVTATVQGSISGHPGGGTVLLTDNIDTNGTPSTAMYSAGVGAGGTAVFDTALNLTVGTHTFTAVYQGDDNFAASPPSDGVTVTVTPAGPIPAFVSIYLPTAGPENSNPKWTPTATGGLQTQPPVPVAGVIENPDPNAPGSVLRIIDRGNTDSIVYRKPDAHLSRVRNATIEVSLHVRNADAPDAVAFGISDGLRRITLQADHSGFHLIGAAGLLGDIPLPPDELDAFHTVQIVKTAGSTVEIKLVNNKTNKLETKLSIGYDQFTQVSEAPNFFFGAPSVPASSVSDWQYVDTLVGDLPPPVVAGDELLVAFPTDQPVAAAPTLRGLAAVGTDAVGPSVAPLDSLGFTVTYPTPPGMRQGVGKRPNVSLRFNLNGTPVEVPVEEVQPDFADHFNYSVLIQKDTPPGPAEVVVDGVNIFGVPARTTTRQFQVVAAGQGTPKPTLTISGPLVAHDATVERLLHIAGVVEVKPGDVGRFTLTATATSPDHQVRIAPINVFNNVPPHLTFDNGGTQFLLDEATGLGQAQLTGIFSPEDSDTGQYNAVKFSATDLTTMSTEVLYVALKVPGRLTPRVSLAIDPPFLTAVQGLGEVIFDADKFPVINLKVLSDRPLDDNNPLVVNVTDSQGNPIDPQQVLQRLARHDDQGRAVPPFAVSVVTDPITGLKSYLYTATYTLGVAGAAPDPVDTYRFKVTGREAGTGRPGYSDEVSFFLGTPTQQLKQIVIEGQQDEAAGLGIGPGLLHFSGGPLAPPPLAGARIVVPNGQGGFNEFEVGVISRGSGNVISRGSGNVISRGSGNVISRGSGNVISRGSGNLFSKPDGTFVFVDDQKNAFPISADAAGVISRGSGNFVYLDGGGNAFPINAERGGAFTAYGVISRGSGNVISRGSGNLTFISEDAASIIAAGAASFRTVTGDNVSVGIVTPGAAGNLLPDQIKLNQEIVANVISRGSGNVLGNSSGNFTPGTIQGMLPSFGSDTSLVQNDVVGVLGNSSGNVKPPGTFAVAAAQAFGPVVGAAAASVAPLAETAAADEAPAGAALDAALLAHFLLWHDLLLERDGQPADQIKPRFDRALLELNAAADVLGDQGFAGATSVERAVLQAAGKVIPLQVASAVPGGLLTPGSLVELTPVNSADTLATGSATAPEPGTLTLGGTVVTVGGHIAGPTQSGAPLLGVPLYGDPVGLTSADPGRIVFRLPDSIVLGRPQLIALTTADGRLAFGAVTVQPAQGVLQFSDPTYTQDKSGTSATVTVTRTGGSSGVIFANVNTLEDTARAGVNFTPFGGSVFFADGDATPKTITIAVLKDPASGGDKTVKLTLSDPVNGATLGTLANALLTILAPQGPPLTPNQHFVAQLYRDLLHREAEPAGLAGWAGALDVGADRTQIVVGIQSSTEYRMDEVDTLYQLYLHRAADPTGMDSALAFLASGGTAEAVAAALAGSPEYFQVRAGSTNDGFLDAVYGDSLGVGRTIDARGRAAADLALSKGTVTREQLALAVFASGEYQMEQVKLFYHEFLGRTAEIRGLQDWADGLKLGLSGDREIAGILGDPHQEYFQKANS